MTCWPKWCRLMNDSPPLPRESDSPAMMWLPVSALTLSALLLLPAAAQAGDPTAWVAVRRVTSGTTVELATGPVRLAGVESIADDAVGRAFLAGLLGRGAVRVQVVVDGQPPGVLLDLPDGRSVNSEILRLGYARATDEAERFRQLGEFRGMEQDARRVRRGLWAAPSEPSAGGAAPGRPGQPARAPDPWGGYAIGRGGLAFGSSARSWLAGVEVAGFVHSNVALYASAGRIADLTPKDVDESLADLEALLEFATGDTWGFEAISPGLFGTAGAKMVFAAGNAVQPYVQAGAGFIRIKTRIEEMDLGDVTEEIADLGGGDLSDFGSTEFLWEVGGGLMVTTGRVLIDVGYVFAKVNESNVSRVAVGAGVRF